MNLPTGCKIAKYCVLGYNTAEIVRIVASDVRVVGIGGKVNVSQA